MPLAKEWVYRKKIHPVVCRGGPLDGRVVAMDDAKEFRTFE